jgi:alanyl-tRNA synthetase
VTFLSMADANARGADAFFDEKYGETVRTVAVEDYSLELCGGTHCRAAGQVGTFVITGERSIGSGMRRIEALTGAGADAWLRGRSDALERAADALGAISTDAIPERVAALQAEVRDTKRRLREGGGSGIAKPGDLRDKIENVADGLTLVTLSAPFESIEAMKGYAKEVRAALSPDIVALGLDADEPQIFVTVGEGAVGRGISAGDLVRIASAQIDGKGGGRPEMAQGRGAKRDGLAAALDAVRKAVREAAGPAS